jgi:hemoglobin-like flavoprotein
MAYSFYNIKNGDDRSAAKTGGTESMIVVDRLFTVKMTQQQVQLIQQQWELLKPDSKIIGRALYEKLFAKAPFIRHLFNEDITEQSCKMAAVLNFIVAKLHRLDDILSDIHDIGVKHRHYKIPPVDYDVVGACLMEAIKEHAASGWNEELHEAWQNLYNTLKTTMLSAQEEK